MKARKNILGGILGGFEDDFEKEASMLSSVITQGTSGVIDAIIDLGQDIAGLEAKSDQPSDKFPSQGSIEFNAKKQEADRKKAFFQTLKEDRDRIQMAKNRMFFEEEIDDIVTNLPTDQKNELLHYQASYKDRSIYQQAELRRKIIENRKKSENKEKSASIPSPAKQPSAMDGAFEGRSGTQGSGTSNLSAQAVG